MPADVLLHPYHIAALRLQVLVMIIGACCPFRPEFHENTARFYESLVLQHESKGRTGVRLSLLERSHIEMRV